MGRYYESQWTLDKTGSYILEILTLNLCKLFFPASFSTSKGIVNGTFELGSYRKLSAVKHIGTEDGLTIIIELLKKIYNGEKHYIFCDQYEITKETVYIDKSASNVKLVFVPKEENITGPEQIIDLVKDILEICPEEGKEYIANLIEYMGNSTFNFKSLINHMEKLRREVYLCAVE